MLDFWSFLCNHVQQQLKVFRFLWETVYSTVNFLITHTLRWLRRVWFRREAWVSPTLGTLSIWQVHILYYVFFPYQIMQVSASIWSSETLICFGWTPKGTWTGQLYGFWPAKRVWGMGCSRVMGFWLDFPAHQVGSWGFLWGLGMYGLWGVWVMRESTVSLFLFPLRRVMQGQPCWSHQGVPPQTPLEGWAQIAVTSCGAQLTYLIST